jgi:hypothetical protein
MNKAKTGKLLSAAAVANMAIAGFAAAPAGAATHSAAGTAGGTAATKLAPRQLGQLEAERARLLGTTVAKPGGFVPRSSAGVRPNSESGCIGHVCLGLAGGGQHVSFVNEHWFLGTGCHIAHFYAYSPGALVPWKSYNPAGFWCSKQQVTWPKSKVQGSYNVGSSFCGSFNNISGFMCEPVR